MIVPGKCLPYVRMHRTGTSREYGEMMRAEFATIEAHLPEDVGSILDVGCGLAGIDVLLLRRYPGATLTLVDGDGHPPFQRPSYGFHRDYRPYCNREATDALLEANGVSGHRWVDAGTRDALSADLVISLLSWGFHYPLAAYAVRGFCIADLRTGQEPERGVVVARFPTASRCAFRL